MNDFGLYGERLATLFPMIQQPRSGLVKSLQKGTFAAVRMAPSSAQRSGDDGHWSLHAESSRARRRERRAHEWSAFHRSRHRHSGGCGGVGRAVSERLVAGGAKVLVWDVADDADERIDLTDETAVDETITDTRTEEGR
ncbi:hypothetical protein AOQ71_00060 [Bradyrhizobium manausense]|uniref:Uncharacterized protein n=1 Tax=Bradyrhizobium manausense TaxID=989370 RepID=A0A0R3E6E5_9BRAD|nr:hypothetical protein AOQ71_00060 [Bradyrhizobium manausense]